MTPIENPSDLSLVAPARGLAKLLGLALAIGLAIAPPAAMAIEPAKASVEAKAERSATPARLTGMLHNGLRYHIERVGSAGGEASFRLIVRVGHLHGLPEQQVAHVVEHIVVEKLEDKAAKGSVWDRAARIGARVNAGTGDLVTSYYVDLPASNPEAAAEALTILLDWATPGALSDEEIDRERRAVIEEARQGAYGEENRLATEQLAILFPGNRALTAPRDPIGTLSATPAAIRTLYGRYHVPANMALVIVGDIDPSATLRAITGRLGAVQPGTVPRVAAGRAKPSLRGGHYTAMKRVESDETKIALIYKIAPAGSNAADRARQAAIVKVADKLVRDAFSALAGRRDRNLVGSLSLASGPPSLDASVADYLTIGAAVGRRTGREALGDMLLVEKTLRTKGFYAKDVERAKAEILSAAAATSPVQDIAGRWTGYLAGEGVAPGTADLRAAIARLTAADINRVLKAWLDPANRDIFLLYPEGDEASVPTAEELPTLVAAAAHGAPADLSRPTPRDLRLDIAAVDTRAAGPVPAPVSEAEGFVRWTLPHSGAALLFRRQGEGVHLAMRRPGGAARFDERFAMSARAIPEIVASSGMGGLSGRDLTRYLEEHGLRLSVSATARQEQVVASGPARDWPLILGLVRERTVNPVCGEKAFSAYIESARDALGIKGEAALADALDRAVDSAVSAKWRPDAADLDAMDLPSMCERYRAMFGDTAGMTIVVEGDLDPAAVYGGALNALDRASSEPQPEVTLRAPPETRAGRTVVRRGAKPAARVILMIAANGDAPFAGVMAEPLQLAIFRRLRSEEKGTYSPFAGVGGSAPGRTILSVSFECSPENADRLIAAAKDEIDKLGRAGPSAADIAAWRTQSVGKARDAGAIADAWIASKSLAPAPAASDAEIGNWVRDFFRSSRVHEFVLLPAA